MRLLSQVRSIKCVQSMCTTLQQEFKVLFFGINILVFQSGSRRLKLNWVTVSVHECPTLRMQYPVNEHFLLICARDTSWWIKYHLWMVEMNRIVLMKSREFLLNQCLKCYVRETWTLSKWYHFETDGWRLSIETAADRLPIVHTIGWIIFASSPKGELLLCRK